MNKHLPKLIVLAMLTPMVTTAQNWGIGFRLGDPSGLTVKHYSGTKAFELSVGRTQFFSRNNYYLNEYDHWYERENFGHKDHQFISYENSVPLGVQFHYLIHKNITGAEGLDWYYGFGAQLRTQQYRFDYRYKASNGNEWIYVRGERVRSLDFGLDGVIGLEYKFKNAPVSLFVDATLYMELVNDPFIFWPQGGFGGRFRF